MKAKILLIERKLNWDDPVLLTIHVSWYNWQSQLHLLAEKHISRCYFDKTSQIIPLEFHGLSAASEHVYAAVVYLSMTDKALGNVQVALVTSKTKLAPNKQLTILRLKLCGAHLLAQLLHHAVYACTKTIGSPYEN